MPVTLAGDCAPPGHERDEVTVHVAPHDCDLYDLHVERDTAPVGHRVDAGTKCSTLIPALLTERAAHASWPGVPASRIGEWTVYSTQAEFERIVRAWLVATADGQDRFGLRCPEVEVVTRPVRLARDRKRASSPQVTPNAAPAGGVILCDTFHWIEVARTRLLTYGT